MAVKKKATGKTTSSKSAASAAKKKKPVKKKRATKKKEKPAPVLRLYWGVFNQSAKRVAVFACDKKKDAQKKAKELTKSTDTPHFVQRVKEAVDV